MQELPQRGPTGQTGSYQFFLPARLNTSSATLIALSLRSVDGTSPGIPSPPVDNDNFVGDTVATFDWAAIRQKVPGVIKSE